MEREINRINKVLVAFNFQCIKTPEIQQWMTSVIQHAYLIDHYKAEHNRILKEATALFEIALSKDNLDDNEGGKQPERETNSHKESMKIFVCEGML